MQKQIKRTLTWILTFGLCFWLSVFHVFAESADESSPPGNEPAAPAESLSEEGSDGFSENNVIIEPDSSDKDESTAQETDTGDENKNTDPAAGDNTSGNTSDTVPDQVNNTDSDLNPAVQPDPAGDKDIPVSTNTDDAQGEAQSIDGSGTTGDSDAVVPENETPDLNKPADTGSGVSDIQSPQIGEQTDPADTELSKTLERNDDEVPADNDTPVVSDDAETALIKEPEITRLENADNVVLRKGLRSAPAVPELKAAGTPETENAEQTDTALLKRSGSVAVPEVEPTEEVSNKYPDLIEGVAYLPFEKEDIPVRYLYSDSYFSGKSTDGFDYDLAAISAVLANTSAVSLRSVNPIEGEPSTYAEQSKNIQTILRELGFENIEINADYEASGTPFSVGVLCASKKVNLDGKEYTILGIFPRSFGYTLEWANNGELGAQGDAEGPALNVNTKILDFVKTYLETNNVSGDLKIWSSGMSRGGGLSMLTSAYIDKQLDPGTGSTDRLFDIDGLRLTKDDVYTYTFGAPNWRYKDNTDDSLFENIHNYAAGYDILYKLLKGSEWGLEHYGSDNVLDTDTANEQLQNMMKEYAAMLGTDEQGLVDTGFFIRKEDGTIVYKPLDPEKTYSYDNKPMNLEDFLDAYMESLTSKVLREKYAQNQEGVQALLTVFMGQRNKLGAFKDAIPQAALDEATDILANALRILIEDGIDAAYEYIKTNADASEFTAGAVTRAFDEAGIKYQYDFENREEIDDKQRAKELYTRYLKQLFNEVVSLVVNDVPGTVTMYSAAGNLWAAHDVNIYASWMRLNSEESGYYLNPLSEGEKWGYRMVYLPDSDDFEIKVYTGTKDNKSLEGTIYSDRYDRQEGFDPYVHIGVDLNGHKVLYIRSDKEYVLELSPLKNQTSSEGLKIDEFEYEHSYKIFEPLHTILVDDHPISFTQILNLIQDGDYELSDSLILEIGGIQFKVDSSKFMKTAAMLRDVPAVEDAENHKADYYWISKLIQLGGAVQDSTGGKVNSLDYYLLDMLFDRDNPTWTGSMTASPFSGYRFLGWYTPDGKLISTSLNFTKDFTFNDSSVLYYARFELIPDDKKDSDPVIIPTDGWNEISIPVEITAARNNRKARIPNTSDESKTSLWMLFLASITAAGISMYLLKEQD